MSLFSKILGRDKTIDTFVEKGTEMLDEAFYTNEEKAENKTKLLDYTLEYAKTTSGQNLARRVIALAFVSKNLFLTLLAIIFYKISPDFSMWVVDLIKAEVWILGAIITFYFGHGLLRTYKNGKK